MSDAARRKPVEPPGRTSPVARPLFQADDEDESLPGQEQTGGAGSGEPGAEDCWWQEWRVESSGNVSRNVSRDSGVPHGFAKNADGIPEMQV